jgi:hypothetical protein
VVASMLVSGCFPKAHWEEVVPLDDSGKTVTLERTVRFSPSLDEYYRFA